MAVTIKKAILWRKELENRPGTLAEALKPLADAGVNLQVVMGYAFPGEHEHAAVEVYPINGGKAEQVASEAGLQASLRIACLIVTGDDSPGLGHAIADKLANNGINISFVMVQVTGRQYHGVFGFETQEDADRAIPIIKEAGKAAAPKRRTSARKATKSAGGRKSTARKTGARKGASRSAGGRKAASTRKSTKAKSTATRKKTTTRKSTAGKSTARKSSARKSTGRKSTTKRGR
jgi:hypothetical protein